MKFSEEHRMTRDNVRHRLWDEKTQNIRKDIKEMIIKYEFHGAPFPWEWVHAMAEINLTGINIPAEYGGAEMDNLSGVLAMIEMSEVWSGGALVLGVGNSLVGYPLSKFGSKRQKEAYLPRLATGKILGSFGLTEPGNGSDAGGIKTFAERIPGGRLVSGQKQFITNIPIAEFIVLFARTNRKEAGYKGITAFLTHLLRPTPPSLIIPPPDHKLGNHAAHMGKVFFDNYPLFESNLFGEEEKGFGGIAMPTLAHGRNWIAAQAIGVMEHALALALEYAQLRTIFGEPLMNHSKIYDEISKLARDIDISKVLLFYSAKLEDEDKEFYHYASLAKLYSSQAARKRIQAVNRIFGGSGYVMETPITPLVADSLVFDIYEGTSEVQIGVILDAWFKNKFLFSAYVEHLELMELKHELKAAMGGVNFLKLKNQRLPAKTANLLPLVAAWDLIKSEFAKEWPKEFMIFQSPELLRDLIFDQIRLRWPNKYHTETEHLLESAKEHLLKNR